MALSSNGAGAAALTTALTPAHSTAPSAATAYGATPTTATATVGVLLRRVQLKSSCI